MSARRERARPRQAPKPINIDGDRLIEMMENVADGQARVVVLLELMTAELAALRLVLAECIKKIGGGDGAAN